MWTDRLTNRARGGTLAALGLLCLAGATAAQQPVQQPAPQTITLDRAIQIALERNPTLKIAENSSELDAISVRQQKMQFLPSVGLTTNTSESIGRSFSQDEGRIITQTTNSVNTGLTSSVVLFNGFSNTAALQQAKLSQAAGTADVSRSRQTVVFTVMSNFLTLITQEEQLRVQQEALTSQLAQEAQIKAYVDAGARAISDLYQQQATTASSRLTVVQTQRSLQLARMGLVRTLHLDPLQDYTFEIPALSDTAATLAAVDLPRLSERALAQRADVSAAETRVSVAEQQLRIAAATRYPSLNLQVGYNSGFSSASPDGFLNQLNSRRGGSIGLGVTLPVFDRLTSRLAKERAGIQVENAKINLENARQNVQIEVRTAYLDLASSQEQLRAAEAQLRAANLALQTSQQRYNVGAANLVELTQAQVAQVRAASDLVNARYGLIFQTRLVDYYIGDIATPQPNP
jgi:outer membrane protein